MSAPVSISSVIMLLVLLIPTLMKKLKLRFNLYILFCNEFIFQSLIIITSFHPKVVSVFT